MLKGKAWMRRRAQVEGEFAIAFTAMHALSLERLRRQRLTTAAGARTAGVAV